MVMNSFNERGRWGPAGKRAALTISFDNLGEAAWLQAGLWSKPIGQHYTASFVPNLVEALGDVRATYFIEASNAALYPDAIRFWQNAGHEVGLHAWQHEAWDRTDSTKRREILTNSLRALRSIGVEPVGFRPPGGALPHEAYSEFTQAGLLYCSDLGSAGAIGSIDGIVRIPFEWRNVDSYVLEEIASPLRLACGDRQAAYSIDQWVQILETTVDAALDEGGQRTVIFHPEFLAVSDSKLNVLKHLIARAKSADMWLGPACDVAKFTRAGRQA